MADVAVDQAPSRVNYGAAHVDRLQTSRVGAAGDPKRLASRAGEKCLLQLHLISVEAGPRDDQTIPVARDQLDGKRRSGRGRHALVRLDRPRNAPRRRNTAASVTGRVELFLVNRRNYDLPRSFLTRS